MYLALMSVCIAIAAVSFVQLQVNHDHQRVEHIIARHTQSEFIVVKYYCRLMFWSIFLVWLLFTFRASLA